MWGGGGRAGRAGRQVRTERGREVVWKVRFDRWTANKGRAERMAGGR